MRKTLLIGEHEVDMVANGLTPVLYKRVFHRDFLAESQKEDTDFTIFQELGFIMSQQATRPVKELMNDITEEEYWEWLSQFDAMDLVNNVGEIFAIYQGQAKSTSKAKKKDH